MAGWFTRADCLALFCLSLAALLVIIMGVQVWTIGLPALIFVVFLSDGIARPSSPWLMPVVSHGPRDSNNVALSFDDGPDPEVTPEILDLLKQHKAKATFFVIGRHLQQYPELGRRIVEEGHELGNHSWTHARTLNFRGAKHQQTEIERCNALIQSIAGQKTLPLYRPPVGLKNPPLAAVVKRMGLDKVIAWSLHSKDTRSDDPDKIAGRVLSQVTAGDILLFHDGHDLDGRGRPATPRALDKVLRGLRDKKLAATSVSGLLSAHD